MKKKLEAELISIAHRILKLKGKEDVIKLHQETQNLYEKLSVLRFYEEHINVVENEIPTSVLEEKLFEEKTPAIVVEEVKEEVVLETVETVEEAVLEEEVEEKFTAEVIKKSLSENETVEEKIEEMFVPEFELSHEEEPEITEEKTVGKQVSLEDFLHEDYKDPEFVKVDDVPAESVKSTKITFEKTEEVVFTTPKSDAFQAEAKSTLNETLLKGIHIGLNDKIAFVKHLFNGSNEDYNRVLSQLSTFDTFGEVQDFIEDIVKPDYNNWHGKDEYSERLLEIIELNFH